MNYQAINELAEMVHANSISKGFWDNSVPITSEAILAKLMLVTTELSEVAEEVRNGKLPKGLYYNRESAKPEGVVVEEVLVDCSDIDEEY